MEPFNPCSNFMDLLNSQQDTFSPAQVPVFSTQVSDDVDPDEEVSGRSMHRRWSQEEDGVLCSAWLNTSKDAVVGNDQKGNAFWSRIALYFNASPKLVQFPNREPATCKQRWCKINDQVSKFVGSFTAAQRMKSSGQNDDDILNTAHELFVNDYNFKFTLSHVWALLRNDQKWCSNLASKGSQKKRKVGDASTTSFSVAQPEEDEAIRPEGVKLTKKKLAAKARGKQNEESDMPSAMSVNEFKDIWSVKEKDLLLKEKLSKMLMIEMIIGKKEPLDDDERALKKKLINDILSS